MTILASVLIAGYATLNAVLAVQARDQAATPLFAGAAAALVAGAVFGSTPLVAVGLVFASAGPVAFGRRRLGRIRLSHHATRAAVAALVLAAWLLA